MSRPLVQQSLTCAQERLLERHRRGLLCMAVQLARRNGVEPTEIMLTIADRKGRVGRALSAALPRASIGPVVLPSRAAELEEWFERLARHGPVWDFTRGDAGIAIIVIDHEDHMAVCRMSNATRWPAESPIPPTRGNRPITLGERPWIAIRSAYLAHGALRRQRLIAYPLAQKGRNRTAPPGCGSQNFLRWYFCLEIARMGPR